MTRRLCHCLFICVLFLCIAGTVLFGADKPLVVVLDPVAPGLSANDATLIVDLFTTLLYSSGTCNLVSRTERNRLLVMNQYPLVKSFSEQEYTEVARIFFVDYIVFITIVIGEEGYNARIGLYDTDRMASVKTIERRYKSFLELVRDCQSVINALVGGISGSTLRMTGRLIEALSPVPIKEKILFVFKRGYLKDDEAESRDTLYRVVSLLTGSVRFIPLAVEIDYEAGAPPFADFLEAARDRGSDYIGFIKNSGTDLLFVVLDAKGAEKATLVLGSALEPEVQAKKIDSSLAGLPSPDIDAVVKEIEKNIFLEKKIDELLATKMTIARRMVFGVSGKIFKSAFVPFLQPLLNLFSCEGSAVWYYDEHFGLGAGYGFSIDFPGTFDVLLENHPRIYEHEIRFSPLSYRTGGAVSLVANVIASLVFHNMYLITTHIDLPPTYEDLGYAVFLKTGVSLGTSFFITEGVSLSIEWVTAYIAIPVVPHPQNNYPLSFSGDLLGIGLCLSF